MKTSTVIAVIAVIVALVVVYVIQQQKKSREVAPLGGGFVKILPHDMRAADIHKIEIYNGDAKDEGIVLARTEEGWSVASRFNSKGDGKKVNDLLDDIKKLEGELRTKKKKLHGDFEITDEKAVHVSLYKEGDTLYRDLLLGKKGERWGEGFVRLADSDEVYLAGKNLRSTLGMYGEEDKPEAQKWLDLKIVDEESDKVAKLVLDMPGKQVVLEKREKKKEEQPEESEQPTLPGEEKEEKKEYEWMLVKPEIEFELKEAAVKSLVSSAATLRGEDVADPAKMDEYGFDSPAYSATLTMEDDSTETLLVGKKTEKDDKRYAKLKEGNTVYVIPKYTVTSVFKKMRELVEIEIWDLDKDAVASIDLEMPDYNVVLERRPKEGTQGTKPGDLEWVIVKPETRFKHKDYKVTSLVGKVAKPAVQDLFLSGELSDYGLDSPEYKALVKMKDGSTHAIFVGNEVEDGDDRYANFEGKDYVYSFTKYTFEEMFPKLPKLLTVEVMKDLEKDKIASLKYHTPDGDFLLRRGKEGEEADTKKWSLKSGEEESEAKGSVVDDILDAVSDIRPDDMFIGKSDADCGLDEPAETLAISTEGTPDRYTLLVGKKVAEERGDRYLKIKGEAEVFVLSEASLEKMFKSVEDLKVKKPSAPKEEEVPPAEGKPAPSVERPPMPPIERKLVPPVEQPPGPPVEKKPAAPSEAPSAVPETPEEAPGEESEKPESQGAPEEPEQEEEEAQPGAPEKEASPESGAEGARKEEPVVPEKEIPRVPLPKPPAPKEPVPLPARPGSN